MFLLKFLLNGLGGGGTSEQPGCLYPSNNRVARRALCGAEELLSILR